MMVEYGKLPKGSVYFKKEERENRVETLIDYLARKRCLIPDYAARHEQGLGIASTRVEKWNDIVVTEHCKHRGMSWTENGVLAIALHAEKKN
jgi:hypothetical protein